MIKSLKLLLLCGLSFVLFSCKNGETQEIQVSIVPQRIIHAEIEQGRESKAYMDEAFKLSWNAGDRISIFEKSTGNDCYAFLGKDGDKSGSFQLSAQASGQPEPLDKYYAAYPWRENNSISSSGVMSLTLPAAQILHEGSFDPDAHLMVAASESSSLSFKNAGCCLGFRLTGDGVKVKSLKLKGNNEELLAGAVTVTAGDDPVCQIVEEGASREITLTAETPVTLNSDKPVSFWMALPPMTFSGGFTLTVTDDQGNTFEKKTDKSVVLQRNHAVHMSAVQVVFDQGDTDSELGIYPETGSAHVYDPASEQISIYKAEGNVWVRFINPTELRVIEVGPIPASVAPGSQFSASLSESVAGKEQSSTVYQMTAESLAGGILTLSSGKSLFILRF